MLTRLSIIQCGVFGVFRAQLAAHVPTHKLDLRLEGGIVRGNERHFGNGGRSWVDRHRCGRDDVALTRFTTHRQENNEKDRRQ